MFSPASSPDWSATEPSCDKTSFVFVSVIHAMSPTPNTSGCPSMLRSCLTGMRSPFCKEIPNEWTSGFPSKPPPHTTVWALRTLPDLSVTRVRGNFNHAVAEPHFDAALFQRSFGVRLDVFLKHSQHRRTELDEDDACVLGREVGIVFDKIAPVELDDRACALDPGWSATDDHHIQRPVFDEGRGLIRRLPSFQNVLLEAKGIWQGIERESVLLRPFYAEKIYLGAETQQEVIVG